MLKLLPLSHECFPVAQRPGTILRDAQTAATTMLLVLRRHRFLVLAIIVLVFFLDRVVPIVVVLPIITRWRWQRLLSSVMMAGLLNVPLTIGTANVVVVVDR